jgi:hypothetical protein
MNEVVHYILLTKTMTQNWEPHGLDEAWDKLSPIEIDLARNLISYILKRRDIGSYKENIIKGVYGDSSKILEELQELQDAEKQGVEIIIHVELSDLYGALEAVAQKYNLSMTDLKEMSDLTKSALVEGERF